MTVRVSRAARGVGGRVMAGVLVSALVQACALPIPESARPPKGKGKFADTRTGADDLRKPAFAPRAVYGKRPPSRLIARDGTTCMVTAEKYENTRIGQSIWCVWTDTDQ